MKCDKETIGKATGQRIDKWLCVARFRKSRELAKKLILGRQVRINGKFIREASHYVNPGDQLTLIIGNAILVIEVCGIAERRGSAKSAQSLYRLLSRHSILQCPQN